MKKIIVLSALFFLSVPYSVHAMKTGGGDLTFKPKNASPVVFSHEKHVNGRSLKCSVCHFTIFQMEYRADKMDMAGIRQGKFCGKCHNGQNAFDVKEAQNCMHCHTEGLRLSQ